MAGRAQPGLGPDLGWEAPGSPRGRLGPWPDWGVGWGYRSGGSAPEVCSWQCRVLGLKSVCGDSPPAWGYHTEEE